jgi:hypothetical protein
VTAHARPIAKEFRRIGSSGRQGGNRSHSMTHLTRFVHGRPSGSLEHLVDESGYLRCRRGTDNTRRNVSPAVHHKAAGNGRWEHSKLREELAVRVFQVCVGRADAGQERPRRWGLVRLVDPDELHATCRQASRNVGQSRRLGLAWRAPGGPNVQDDYMTAQAGQPQGSASQGWPDQAGQGRPTGRGEDGNPRLVDWRLRGNCCTPSAPAEKHDPREHEYDRTPRNHRTSSAGGHSRRLTPGNSGQTFYCAYACARS